MYIVSENKISYVSHIAQPYLWDANLYFFTISTIEEAEIDFWCKITEWINTSWRRRTCVFTSFPPSTAASTATASSSLRSTFRGCLLDTRRPCQSHIWKAIPAVPFARDAISGSTATRQLSLIFCTCFSSIQGHGVLQISTVLLGSYEKIMYVQTQLYCRLRNLKINAEELLGAEGVKMKDWIPLEDETLDTWLEWMNEYVWENVCMWDNDTTHTFLWPSVLLSFQRTWWICGKQFRAAHALNMIQQQEKHMLQKERRGYKSP